MESDRFLIGCVTQGLGLAGIKPCIWVPLFINKLVNVLLLLGLILFCWGWFCFGGFFFVVWLGFFFGCLVGFFSSSLPWVLYSSVMKHTWQFQFIHSEKCFLLWTFKDCLHNGNRVDLLHTQGRKESNTSKSLLILSVKGGGVVNLETQRSLQNDLWAASVKQIFCLWTVSVWAHLSLELF